MGTRGAGKEAMESLTSSRMKLRKCAWAFVLLTACGDLPTNPPADGSTLELSIVGLPAGAAAGVNISGNGGETTHTLNSSGSISVPPGTYTVTASGVKSGAITWYPNVNTHSVDIAFGQKRTMRVRFGSLPVSGTYVEQLERFDSAVVAYMTARHIGAGTLTISRGQELYRRSFGWSDSARTTLLSPNAMLRLASNSKPVTSAAIRKLVSQGLLTFDTKAFVLLGLTPAGSVSDSRIYDITVQHLLDHTGGWNRSIAGDVMFKSREVSSALGIATPPTKTQVAQWMITQPLQHAPGSATSYSNFGFTVLGLIIEKVSGQSFGDYVRQNIFSTAKANEVIEGRSLRVDRDAREPFYSDPYKGCSVFVVNTCVLVPWPDGGWYIEAFDSCGGLVASAPAMASFLESFWISGQPRTGGTGSFTFYGSLDGTFTLMRQRTDGMNIVALFNQRTDPSGLPYEDIRQILDGVADRLPSLAIASRR
jgi:CubicO group peptidase (beta-lactamase class C family)